MYLFGLYLDKVIKATEKRLGQVYNDSNFHKG